MSVRRYRGFICDSDRWSRFPLRDDDVVISSPSKCGTTWVQTIVGMLLTGRVELDRPLGLVSPWLDMSSRSEAELFALLAAQEHRRWIKTHTPLDGLPRHPGVTYLCLGRHPLDVAVSDWDHRENADLDRLTALRFEASGEDLDGIPWFERPTELGAYLRWWIHDETPATGTGTTNLAELAHHVATAWAARDEPGVHLVHHADLVADREGQMRRLARILGVEVDEDRWPALVEAAGLDAMRDRADRLAPDAHLGLWRDDRRFFRSGGRRGWSELLDADDLAAYERRLVDLAGPEVARWVEGGTVDGGPTAPPATGQP